MKRSTLLLAALTTLAACSDTSPTEGRAPVAAPAEGFAARGELGQGFILGRDGRPLAVTYEIHGGRAIWQGDIDLGPASSIARTAEELLRPGGARQGVTIDGSARRWLGRIVPYVIDASLPSPWRVTDAIAHIEASTYVDFVPRTTQTDYVRVAPSSLGCSSAMGRQGGAQTISLTSDCGTGSTIHELLHALGMGHEQSRCDRNSFVEILTANIESGKENNFYQLCDGYTDLHAYDEGSIMHYPANGFGRVVNGVRLQTIRSLRGLEHLMGQRNGMSTADVATINLIYPPPPPPPPVVTSVTTNPSPAKQYLSFTITINGSGFDPATAEVRLLGTSSCPSPGCTPTTFTTRTSTQLVMSIALSMPGTSTVSVRNGPTGLWSTSGHTVTVAPMY